MAVMIVINTSGNVGKSNLSRGLYQFMSENKVIIELETHNSSSFDFNDVNVYKYDGSDIRNMLGNILSFDNVVVDVGASVVESFLIEILKTPEILSMIDYYLVPTVNDTKQTSDTLKTLTILNTLGISSKSIKVVFNKVKKNIKSEFSSIIGAMKKLNINVDLELAIKEYEVLENLERMKILSGEVAESKEDYRKIAKEKAKAGDIKGSKEASDKLFTQMLAKSYHSNLQQVYNSIVKE